MPTEDRFHLLSASKVTRQGRNAGAPDYGYRCREGTSDLAARSGASHPHPSRPVCVPARDDMGPILRRIEQQPGLAQNQLAPIAEVAPITATRLIDRIETLGLVGRDADPKDRIWRLRMTPAAAPVLRDNKR